MTSRRTFERRRVSLAESRARAREDEADDEGGRRISTRRMQGGVLSKYPSGDSAERTTTRRGLRACVLTLPSRRAHRRRRRHGNNRTPLGVDGKRPE